MHLCVGKSKPHPFKRQKNMSPRHLQVFQVLLRHFDAKATMPFDRIPFHFLGSRNFVLIRRVPMYFFVLVLLFHTFSISLFIRRRCLLTGFLFTSWPPGILLLYSACRCVFWYLCFFMVGRWFVFWFH